VRHGDEEGSGRLPCVIPEDRRAGQEDRQAGVIYARGLDVVLGELSPNLSSLTTDPSGFALGLIGARAPTK